MTAPTYDPTNVGNAPGQGPLRVGGQSGTLPVGKANLPSTTDKRHDRQAAALEMVRDVWEGQSRLHEKAPLYLPPAPAEDPANYKTRVQRSPLFNMYRTAIETMVGFIFRKDPVLGEDVPPVMVEHWENIDLAGTHGDVFARDLEQDAMNAGHAAILVDFPRTDGGQTREDETLGLIRPYWIPIKKDNIVSVRETVVNGQTLLSQVVLKECTMVPDGDYGEREQMRYRVLYRDEAGVVGFRLEEVTKANTIAVVDEGIYTNQVEIPLAEISTSGKVGRLESRPTVEDVAYLTIAHFQQYSDYATSLHKTCVPIFTMAGFGEVTGNIVVGSNTALTSSNPAAKAAYVSHDGASLASCKAALDDLKSDIGTASVAMLAPQKRAAETAKGKEIDKGGSDSKLSVTARGLQDGLERALSFHARYLKLPSGGSISINREFTDMQMAPELLTAITNAWERMKLPNELYIEKLIKGGILPDSVKAEDIAGEMEAAQVAAEAKADEMLDRQLAAKAGQPQVAPANAVPMDKAA